MFDFFKKLFRRNASNSSEIILKPIRLKIEQELKEKTLTVPFQNKIIAPKTYKHFKDKVTPYDEDKGEYLNSINEERDYNTVNKLKKMLPQQIEFWFNRQIENGYWCSNSVFKIVAKELKPFHEQYLISEMDKVTQGRIEGWINARKKEGYFFSDLAYEKADKIFSGEIENRKAVKPKKKKSEHF